MLASFELSWDSNGLSIAPSLRVKRTVRFTAPAFEIMWKCENGRLPWETAELSLNRLLADGHASVDDTDPEGKTWLEVLPAQ